MDTQLRDIASDGVFTQQYKRGQMRCVAHSLLAVFTGCTWLSTVVNPSPNTLMSLPACPFVGLKMNSYESRALSVARALAENTVGRLQEPPPPRASPPASRSRSRYWTHLFPDPQGHHRRGWQNTVPLPDQQGCHPRGQQEIVPAPDPGSQ